MSLVTMSTSPKKRKRSPNWFRSEKLLLLDLVEKHLDIVEIKKLDRISTLQKVYEWKNMAVEYNSQTTKGARTAENLRSQWECMKKWAKKVEKMDTGAKERLDPIHIRVIQLIMRSVGGETATWGGEDCLDGDTGDTGDDDSAAPNKSVRRGPHAETDPLHDLHDPESETGSLNEEDLETLEDELTPKIEILVDESCSGTMHDKVWSDYNFQQQDVPISNNSTASAERIINMIQNRSNGKKTSQTKPRRLSTHTANSASSEQMHEETESSGHKKTTMTKQDMAVEMHNLDMKIKTEILEQAKLRTKLLLLDVQLKEKQLREFNNIKREFN